MATAYQLHDFHRLAGRKIFFDANVLIYLFWPTGRHSYEQNYASVFRNLLRQGNDLTIDFRVISEIVNRISRIEYGKYLTANGLTKRNLKYKTYRNSKEGQTMLHDIYLIVEQDILTRFRVIGKLLFEADIRSFLVVDQLDFADKAIAQLCSEENLVLLTNDTDFGGVGIDILSGHPNYSR